MKTYYEEELRKLGCDLAQIESPLHVSKGIREIPKRICRLFLQDIKSMLKHQFKIPLSVNLIIQGNFVKYQVRLIRNYIYAKFGKMPNFANHYLYDFWTIVARKRMES